MTNTRKRPSETCPSLEDLATFLDGRVRGPEHESIQAHLADCPRCYETFADTLRFRLETEAAPGGRVIARSFSGAGMTARLAAAAVVVAALVAGVFLYQNLSSGGRTGEGGAAAGEVIARLVSERPATLLTASLFAADGWSTTRGPGPDLDARRRGFRIGVRTVDLEVALLAGDGRRALALLSELSFLARGLEGSGNVVELYDDLRVRLESGERPAGLIPRAERAVDSIRGSVSAPDLSLGAWAEIGLLAARTGETRTLDGDPFRDLRSSVSAADLSEPVRERLVRIDDLLGAGATRDGLAAVEAAFVALLERGGETGPI